ncbi:hypothetical protein WH47_06590 [Habropoda laboriosa]|uniref:CCHC-type domain-containing protein n=1 Tax=Habropoda laboriosa TaxID=597456 RepID=A0A0L7QIZ3_9HYME|nr:hypothetical protein WH47_06590 [Habropoda laboriosa]
MLWRVYKIKEYINITRCYKCHAYGHVSKHCSATQTCECCSSPDHLHEKCPTRTKPKCPLCTRFKRKDTNHSVRSKECPEYKRQLELYKDKVQWT